MWDRSQRAAAFGKRRRASSLRGRQRRISGRRLVILGGFDANNKPQEPILCNAIGGPRHSHGQAEVADRRPAGPHALRMAGSFFLGPPLPLQSQLYVLAEDEKGEIRLLALDAATRADGSCGRSSWPRPSPTSHRIRCAAWRARRLPTPTGFWSVPRRRAPWWASIWPRGRCLWGYCFGDEGNNAAANRGTCFRHDDDGTSKRAVGHAVARRQRVDLRRPRADHARSTRSGSIA